MAHEDVTRAIETSIRDGRTVELYRGPLTRSGLEEACEDFDENDELGLVTFWGADEDGDKWRVSIKTR